MRDENSATHRDTIAVPPRKAPAGTATPTPSSSGGGTLLALLGIGCFSLTFPATAWGLESFGPWSLVAVRSVLAAALAGAFLLGRRVSLPGRAHWPGLAVVAAGVVLGFPLLSTLALETSTTSHAAVVVGLLPLTTAVFSALRSRRWPPRRFWPAALAGAAVVGVFTVTQGGGGLSAGDGYLLAALLVCAAGYAEGGRLSAVLPGWQVTGWALVLSLPVTLVGASFGLALEPVQWSVHGLVGLVWVAAGSTFFGLYVWYRGMAAIGVPRASQLQLAQPLLTMVWSVTLLGEHLSPAAPLAAAGVLVCIALTQWAARPRRATGSAGTGGDQRGLARPR